MGISKERQLAIDILDLFEDVLAEHNIYIPDDYREGDESEACIFGDTYYALEERITEFICDYKREVKICGKTLNL